MYLRVKYCLNLPTEQVVTVRTQTFPLLHRRNRGTMGAMSVVAKAQLLKKLRGFQDHQCRQEEVTDVHPAHGVGRDINHYKSHSSR